MYVPYKFYFPFFLLLQLDQCEHEVDVSQLDYIHWHSPVNKLLSIQRGHKDEKYEKNRDIRIEFHLFQTTVIV